MEESLENKLKLFEKVGLTSALGKKKMPKKTQEKKEPQVEDMFAPEETNTEEIMQGKDDQIIELLQAISSKQDVLSARLANLELLVQSNQTYSGGSSTGFKPKKKEQLVDVVTTNAVVEKVYKDFSPEGKWKGPKYSVLFNGARASTLDKSIGETAKALEGQEATISFGKNSKGYLTLDSVSAL